ncbi:phosphoribosylformylglycinamidine cyclo-ligase [Macrococcoides canis]|uniref:phosphoribosylformylglycinamidine cyclo-ligase n=1 Tax=Macrococcoides canis TaxID=1855823 RepID=UPI0013E91283|nr:phosphoribosylformylglycinamidine cyclo-ligase [Macrococcus canis]QIH75583.1 phosphoribosylformylglycinamidine cyclo-ligase [Macrococcus canis]QNR07528.1 phosphoribosylformylglycinamidine cyclo-ligase [Macrococcus canis]QTQ08990.1 phosphoribosylformylglycinamidine cyclo-ligase [Macrococcus canis]UTH03249.1 phosphoribosylformylglycinamidine cyclo-ligase [Macrococcus canis]
MAESYKQSGVDIHAGYEAVERMKKHVNKTMRKEVLGGLGSFGAAFDLSQLNMKAPVLVSGTDGVGTKLRLAIDSDRHDTIGIDAVAMCVNDILTTGAMPLYFLDYLALNKVDPVIVEQIVKGVADGCLESECALIGGETAEMGDMYHTGDYDIAGFAVGAVEKDAYITGEKIAEGDVILGLASSGIHSNGYSLVRKIIKDNNLDLNAEFENGKTLLDVVLEPTRLYVKSAKAILNAADVHGMCHVTGGGFIENVPRVFTGEGLYPEIDVTNIPRQKIFDLLQEKGNIDKMEMYNIFNMGIGFIFIVPAEDVEKVRSAVNEEVFEIGRVVRGDKEIEIKGV